MRCWRAGKEDPEGTAEGPRGFLLELGTHGVYTCARTNRNGGVVRWAAHKRRLADGFAALHGAQGANENDVERAMEQAVEAFGQCQGGGQQGILLLTLFVGVEKNREPFIAWHVMAMPQSSVNSKQQEVGRVIVTHKRTPQGNREESMQMPWVKSTRWISERVVLETLFQDEEKAEIVMLNRNGTHILEGLVTNVFIVRKTGLVETACDRVLNGTMREHVIDICRRLEIPLLLSSGPLVEDAINGQWADFLLVSVTKPVVRARSIQFDGGPELVFDNEHPVTRRIREQLFIELE